MAIVKYYTDLQIVSVLKERSDSCGICQSFNLFSNSLGKYWTIYIHSLACDVMMCLAEVS